MSLPKSRACGRVGHLRASLLLLQHRNILLFRTISQMSDDPLIRLPAVAR
ncbi:hypothetical protein SM0020_24398 [Sinorhizobium meliloti CCNWSX0020]|uniref:Uncharacterized protein n=1 Tax=Sinorhizobium meliloti CCNWSX0020 TaxID=1107881 RepID=H0G5W4_RHIML|nr:hypothetical protein SM0020_24398 [Sinorhizobium meliloti CCNWSX0020]